MTEHKLFKAFQQFIIENRLIERNEKIIVSVSGGIDSMTLLNLMLEFKNRMKLTIGVAHFNHQLRGSESNEDEAFVHDYAKKRNILCFIESADTNQISEAEKLSIQETARNLRYNFFSKIRKSLGYQKIATAHNADDNAETILFNIFRGTGIHGMTGIPIFRKDQLIIRPLLFASRDEITSYATEMNIPFREDSSNLKKDYTRNFIRHELLPSIQQNINPNVRGTLLRSSHIFTGLEKFISTTNKSLKKKIIRSKTKNEIIISRHRFISLPQFSREQLLYEITRDFCRSEIDYSTIITIMKISEAGTGTFSSIGNDVLILRDRNNLIIRRWERPPAFYYPIRIEAEYKFNDFKFKSSKISKPRFTQNRNIELIDGDLLGKDVHIRSWHDGDWFTPLGMNQKKKLSDFFIDEKIPLLKKLTIPILESDGRIVWVCGMRLDNRFRITKASKNIIKLEYKRIKEPTL
ncbi:MAG: tRNA lysidine(34) synthetase TilS [Ignavibacteriales bacterium]|nr:tRNA lysidine(34) synthetase TilS [Ignavibacteriales bacterium]